MLAGCTVDFKDQMQNDECKAAACFAHKIEIGSSAVCVGHVSGPKGKVTVSHSCLAMVDTVPLNEDGSLHVESSHYISTILYGTFDNITSHSLRPITSHYSHIHVFLCACESVCVCVGVCLSMSVVGLYL